MEEKTETKDKDLEDKVNTIRHIIEICHEDFEKPNTVPNLKPLDRTAQYTGKNLSFMETLLLQPDSQNISHWIKENKEEIKDYINYKIHHKMIECYVTKRNMFTECNFLEDWGSTVIKKNGFKWKRIPDSNVVLFIEDPEQQAARVRYLLKMKEIRENKKHIIYFEHKLLNNDEAGPNQEIHVLIAASPQLGLIAFSTAAHLNVKALTEWLDLNIAPHLTDSSALIIETKNLDSDVDYLTVPKIGDSTEKMLLWLKRNGISHTPSMHRAELYDLIKKYNTTVVEEKPLKYFELLKSTDAEMVLKPIWEKLNYFKYFWDDLKIKRLMCNDYKRYLKHLLTKYEIRTWKQFDDSLAEYEKELFVEDMQLEEVIDKLTASGKFIKELCRYFPMERKEERMNPFNYNIII